MHITIPVLIATAACCTASTALAEEQIAPVYVDAIDCAAIFTVLEFSARESKEPKDQEMADAYKVRTIGWLNQASQLSDNDKEVIGSDHLAAFKIWVDKIKDNSREDLSAMVFATANRCGKWEKTEPTAANNIDKN